MKIFIKSFEELSSSILYQILKLRVDVFVVEQNCPYPELDNKDQEAKHFYMEREGRIIGYLRMYIKAENQAAIGRVITHPGFRKQGLANQLMQRAIDSVDSGTLSIFLQAQSHLQPFYETFGFQKISDLYLEDGIPHIDMELLLEKG